MAERRPGPRDTTSETPSLLDLPIGFAIIPLIFTISEDAMNNVPKSLISASLALGRKPLANGREGGAAHSEPRRLFCHHDRVWKGGRRDDDRSYGNW